MIKEDDLFITVGDENGYESSVDNDDDISSDDDPDSNKLEAEVNNNMYRIHSNQRTCSNKRTLLFRGDRAFQELENRTIIKRDTAIFVQNLKNFYKNGHNSAKN